jgi:hypothetical protein
LEDLDGHTVHHDIHASELGPDLRKNADMGTIDHVRLEQLEIGNVGVVALKLAHFLDLLQFKLDKRIVRIAFTMNQGEDGMAIFPPVLSC